MINYSIPNIYYDEDASRQLGNMLKTMGIKKVFCVFDKGIKAAGIIDAIEEQILAAGIGIAEYSEVVPDPTVKVIDQAGQLARAEQVDCVVAVGGGSSIDTGKMAAVLAVNGGSARDYFGLGRIPLPGLPFFAVPTTAGTGSEITACAVITDEQSGKKLFVMDSKMLAKTAVLDPKLLTGLPTAMTVFSGMDALSHAIESYTSLGNNPLVEVTALRAIRMVTENLPKCVEDGSDIEARGNMLLASAMAGMSFGNSAVHAGHAIAHATGARWHIPHGAACAIALPVAISHCGSAMPERIERIAAEMRIDLPQGLSDQEKADKLAEAVYQMGVKFKIPTLRDFGADPGEIDEIVAATLQETSHSASGVPFTEECCRKAYEKLFSL